MSSIKEYPMVDGLSSADRGTLAAVTADALTVQDVETWEDDHLECVGAVVNGIKVSFWWLGPEGAGAFHYPDSPTARKTILEIVQNQLEMFPPDID